MESSSVSGSSKRAKAPGNITQCSVDGCNADLSLCKEYHRRHKVCEIHSKTAKVTIGGRDQRFCQQCSRFHSLGEFDEGKRSCRKRLDGHNRRRRKPQNADSRTLLVSFSSPQQILASNWGAVKPENDMLLYNNHQQQQMNSYNIDEFRHNSLPAADELHSCSSSSAHNTYQLLRLNQFQFVHNTLVDPMINGSSSSKQIMYPNSDQDGLISSNHHHQQVVVDSDHGALSLLSSAAPPPPPREFVHQPQSLVHNHHLHHYADPGGPHYPFPQQTTHSHHEIFHHRPAQGSSSSSSSSSSSTVTASHQTLTFMWE